MELIIFLFCIASSLYIYFLPSILGSNNKNFKPIFVLNLFLGWTFIGWVIALMMAVNNANKITEPNENKPKSRKSKFTNIMF